MTTFNQLEIPKRNAKCFHQGESLVPGMDIYSLLLEETPKEYTRRDFCSVCWERDKHLAEEKEGRIYWKSKIEKRFIPDKSSKTERALYVLQEMLQHPVDQEEKIFVLCLFLSHARQLALRKEWEEQGETYHLYEILRKEECFKIKAVSLSQLQIEKIQEFLAQELNMKN